jgi:SpoVK/Ycf46/Vps4 family AAA+-type ATPase
MSNARHILALLRSHFQGDETQFYSVAMQLAAHEARLGHIKIAEEMSKLIDAAKAKGSAIEVRNGPMLVPQPKGDLANLLSVHYPEIQLTDMVIPEALANRLHRVIKEQKQQQKLREHGLRPRRKLLLLGPPGSGKTMTAAILASELKLPLFTILLEGLITKFMGETAAKLRLIFEAMVVTKGVYLFDEFDAIGARRSYINDVGEIRRVLNSFLQLLEKDDSIGLVVAATNHPELLDPALFRRFDDVIEYSLPNREVAEGILKSRLVGFSASSIDWDMVLRAGEGLSQADLARAADEAVKDAILSNTRSVRTDVLVSHLSERKAARR